MDTPSTDDPPERPSEASQEPLSEQHGSANRSGLSEREIRRRFGRVFEMALAAADRAEHPPSSEAELTSKSNGCTIDAHKPQHASNFTRVAMKQLYIRLPDELHEQLVKLAEKERRSLNAQVVYLLEHAVQPSPNEQSPAPSTKHEET
ncbi:MAG: toxin-antitoxin system HicB family antitoxin [Ktedonobacteraceae bacterium]